MPELLGAVTGRLLRYSLLTASKLSIMQEIVNIYETMLMDAHTDLFLRRTASGSLHFTV
jgi:hypothetical protein